MSITFEEVKGALPSLNIEELIEIIEQAKRELYAKVTDVSLEPNIIVTPINKLPTSKSALDYSEQNEREKRNEQVMWDDTPTNQ